MQYTGVLHMHSTHSYDGKMGLHELKELLVSKGISFACMTEHTDELTTQKAQAFVEECERLSDDTFVFVPGFEVPYKDAHILHIGVTEFVCSFADAVQLKQWHEKASFVILAHPVRNKFIVDETMLEVIDALEVWNQQYEGKKVPRVRSMKLLHILQTQHPKLLATGGLDLHRKEHFGAPLTFIEMETLSKTAIIRALQTGKYTFGNGQTVLHATGAFRRGTTQTIALPSAVSIGVIVAGKFINRILAQLGISLPRSLREKIRSRV